MLGLSAPQPEVYRAPPVLLEATVAPPANHFAPHVLLEATTGSPANHRATLVSLALTVPLLLLSIACLALLVNTAPTSVQPQESRVMMAILALLDPLIKRRVLEAASARPELHISVPKALTAIQNISKQSRNAPAAPRAKTPALELWSVLRRAFRVPST